MSVFDTPASGPTVKIRERQDFSHLTDQQRLLVYKRDGVQPGIDPTFKGRTLVIVFEDGIKIALKPPEVKKSQ